MALVQINTVLTPSSSPIGTQVNHNMSHEEVASVLESLGFQQYEANFKRHNIETIDDLMRLDDDDLKEIGIRSIGHRRRLQSWIEEEVYLCGEQVILGGWVEEDEYTREEEVSVDLSDMTTEQVADALERIDHYYSRDDIFSVTPQIMSCSNEKCNSIFGILAVDMDVVYGLATFLCEQYLEELADELNSYGIPPNAWLVDLLGVIETTKETFGIIIHRYSHYNTDSIPESVEDLQELNAFRLAAMIWAAMQTIQVVSEDVLQSIADQLPRKRRGKWKKFRKGLLIASKSAIMLALSFL